MLKIIVNTIIVETIILLLYESFKATLQSSQNRIMIIFVIIMFLIILISATETWTNTN
jgi:hypothetical protein